MYNNTKVLDVHDEGVKLNRPGFYGQLIKPHV